MRYTAVYWDEPPEGDELYMLPSHIIRREASSIDEATRISQLQSLAESWGIETEAQTVRGVYRALVLSGGVKARINAALCRSWRTGAVEYAKQVAAKRDRTGVYWLLRLGMMPRDRDMSWLSAVLSDNCGQSEELERSHLDRALIDTVERSGLLDGLETMSAYMQRQAAAIQPVVRALDKELFKERLGYNGVHSVLLSADARSMDQVGAEFHTANPSQWKHRCVNWHAYRLSPEWLSCVHAQGLSQLDGCLCLHATRVESGPDGDGVWRVKIVRQKFGRRRWRNNGKTSVESGFAVRFGGALAYAGTVECAKQKAVRDVRARLMGEEKTDGR